MKRTLTRNLVHVQRDSVQQPRQGGELHQRGRDGGGREFVDHVHHGDHGDHGGEDHEDEHG